MQKISEFEKYYSSASKRLFKYKAIKDRLPIDTVSCAEHLYMDMKTSWILLSVEQRDIMRKACGYAITDYVNTIDYSLIIMNAAGDPKHHLDGTLTETKVTAAESADATLKYDRHIHDLHKRTIDDINTRARGNKNIKHTLEYREGAIYIRKHGHFVSQRMNSGVDALLAMTEEEVDSEDVKMVAIGENYDKS